MSTRRALALSFLDRYSGLLLHTASSMVVARLLTPEEIGVYSVTMVLLGFVATFRDLGAGQYLVQQNDLNPERIRATWSVQLGLGLGIALLALLSAVPVAGFYREPRMVDIMLILALNFALTPLLAFPNAWLVRDMRFGTIASVRFAGSLAHAAVAIGMAWAGYGPVSLAWANVMTTLVGILVVWMLARPAVPWRPSLAGTRDVVSFGGKLTLVSLSNSLAAGAPELMLGKLQGMVAAGHFSRAQALVSMFQRLVMDAVNAVALPYFARQSRESRPMGEAFVTAMELVVGIGWAFFAAVAVLAYPAISLLYGGQWGEAVDPARWLALAFAASIPSALCYNPLVAVGAVTETLRTTVVTTLLVLIAVLVGARNDLVVLSQGLVIANMLTALLWLRLVRRRIGYSLPAILLCWAKSLALAVGTVIVPLLVVNRLGWRSPDILTTFVLAIPGGLTGFFATAWLIDHQVWREVRKALRI